MVLGKQKQGELNRQLEINYLVDVLGLSRDIAEHYVDVIPSATED